MILTQIQVFWTVVWLRTQLLKLSVVRENSAWMKSVQRCETNLICFSKCSHRPVPFLWKYLLGRCNWKKTMVGCIDPIDHANPQKAYWFFLFMIMVSPKWVTIEFYARGSSEILKFEFIWISNHFSIEQFFSPTQILITWNRFQSTKMHT